MPTSPAPATGDQAGGPVALPRRQEGGSGSARSVLLTILGEFVLPTGEAPWTATLLHVAAGLGLAEKSARQALARLAAQPEEIIRLREGAAGTTRVSRLPPPRTTVIGTCS